MRDSSKLHSLTLADQPHSTFLDDHQHYHIRDPNRQDIAADYALGKNIPMKNIPRGKDRLRVPMTVEHDFAVAFAANVKLLLDRGYSYLGDLLDDAHTSGPSAHDRGSHVGDEDFVFAQLRLAKIYEKATTPMPW
jgi:hypothetical protein